MPNIVITPPQDVDEQGSSPQIKIDETLLHPRRPQHLRIFCILHKILTDDEFEEEERYLYGPMA